jgi:hypothetical protein
LVESGGQTEEKVETVEERHVYSDPIAAVKRTHRSLSRMQPRPVHTRHLTSDD